MPADELTPLKSDNHSDNRTFLSTWTGGRGNEQGDNDNNDGAAATTTTNSRTTTKNGLLPERGDDDDNEEVVVEEEEEEEVEPQRRGLRRKWSRDRPVSTGSTTSDTNNNTNGHHHHRRDSSALDIALESLHDIADVVAETWEHTIEEVQHAVVEGMEEIHEVFDEPIVPVKPREEGDHSQKLSALAVAILVFYKVSGGPFGMEPGVKAAGPFYALMGYIIFPIIWCIPEALITAELGSAFPEPSGSVAWVEEAFGPQVSLLCGYFHWISGATDNAIYPSLFLRYVSSWINNGDPDAWSRDMTRFLFTVAITVVLSAINYTGLELVGNLSMIVCVISMSPFIVMTICAIPQLDTDRWMVLPNPNVHLDINEYDEGVGLIAAPMFAGVMWRPLLNSLFWNLNSFDVGASFAGEIRDSQRVFPRAMFLSIGFVVLGYLIPLAAALGAVDTKQNDWDAGYFTAVSTQIAGPWLGTWTVFAAAVSNIALFEAEMSGDAYQLMGMADRGLIPKLFTKRSRYGTPTNGILLGTFVIFAMSVADFDQLVEMLNFAYSLSMLMEFGAFVKLRITDNDVERPYRIPLNTVGCVLFVTPPTLFLIYLMLIASKSTYFYLLMLIVFGVAFYLVQKFAKHYKWCEYVEAPPVRRNKRAGHAGEGTASVSSEDPSTGTPITTEP